MKLTYILNSSFALETESFNALFDYYKDADQGAKIQELLQDPKKLYVLATHGHADHFDPKILNWKKQGEPISYIFSSDIADFRAIKSSAIIYVKKGDHYQSGNFRLNVFGSTDAGVSFLLETENRKIFHAGDLNNWHWKDESTQAEVKKAERDFIKELECILIYTDSLDLALFPIDSRQGSDYMRGAEQFIDAGKVKNFAPMHFMRNRNGFKDAEAFKPYAEKRGTNFIALSEPGQSIEF